MKDATFLRNSSASISAIARGALGLIRGERKTCVACGGWVIAFLPWRGGSAGQPEIARELGMVGSDVDNFGCPRCGSTDRERHLLLYLAATGLEGELKGARVLHFAPERKITGMIESLEPSEYVKADLSPNRADVARVDIERMPYEDEHFDWVIANHVLEHVGDLPSALREISRVLSPGGMAVLQTPWCRGPLSTIEDGGVATPRARRALYAQEDHVRLFGRDVMERICPPGMRPDPREHADVLHDFAPQRYGVNADESLMLFVKD